LGTTLDLFTEDWAARGSVFRNGFGCTPGGQWLDENAWKYGFVLPYPIHPDDRKDGSRCEVRRDHAVPVDPKTGYKNEPWHLRFIGVDAAARYRDAWLASGPGTFDEITLEQWLRRERGFAGDAELPVCDGCQCGACATLSDDDAATPCGKESLRLDARRDRRARAGPHSDPAARDERRRPRVRGGRHVPRPRTGARRIAPQVLRSPRSLAPRARARARARRRALAVAHVARRRQARRHLEPRERHPPREVRRHHRPPPDHPSRRRPHPQSHAPARRRRTRHPRRRRSLACLPLRSRLERAGVALAPAGLDAGGAAELAVDAANALDLAFGGEALVEALGAEALLEVAPRRQL